jgi:methionine synthase II (cobalamin-independent)
MISKTTHVGSLPRISGLDVEQSAEAAIKMQIATGVDEVNDGEYGRNIFFGDITSLPGFQSGVRKIRFSAGDITSGPQVVGKVQYDTNNPTAPKEVYRTKKILEGLGMQRKIKVTIPSVTMLSIFYPKPQDASPELKKIYPTFDKYAQEVISIVLNEAKEAFKAGADVVQFDAPDFLEYPAKDKMRERIGLENEVLKHLDSSKLEHHSCWGNYLETQVCTDAHYDVVLPEIYDLKSDNIGPA